VAKIGHHWEAKLHQVHAIAPRSRNHTFEDAILLTKISEPNLWSASLAQASSMLL
jgi:hypothetical protein